LDALRGECAAVRARATAAETRAEALVAERPSLASVAARRSALEAATAQLGEVEAAFARAETQGAETAAALEQLGGPEDAGIAEARAEVMGFGQEVDAAAQTLTERRARVQALETELARAEGERAALGDPETRHTELTAREETLATTAADW